MAKTKSKSVSRNPVPQPSLYLRADERAEIDALAEHYGTSRSDLLVDCALSEPDPLPVRTRREMGAAIAAFLDSLDLSEPYTPPPEAKAENTRTSIYLSSEAQAAELEAAVEASGVNRSEYLARSVLGPQGYLTRGMRRQLADRVAAFIRCELDV